MGYTLDSRGGKIIVFSLDSAFGMHRKMNTETARALMREQSLPLTLTDLARLTTEVCEEMGDLVAGLPRGKLVVLLRHVLREGARVVRAGERTCSFREAAWASYEARVRKGRRAATLGDLRHFIGRMLRVEGFGEKALRSLTTAECRVMLETAFGSSSHSYRKGRAILHSIFAYGMRREWCDGNPAAHIEVPGVAESPIEPLSMAEVQRLERAAARPEFAAMRLPLHLMLYCGLRPTEVARLNPQRDIDWRERLVVVRPQTSKTGGGRVVPLRVMPPADAAEIPRHWRAHWRSLRLAAGFTTWRADACRHTFASYHRAYFRNLDELQSEMGHRDSTLLRTRYTLPVSPAAARAFWQRR